MRPARSGTVIKVWDPREKEIPSVGVVHVADPETGADAWVDTSRRRVRRAYSDWFARVGENERKLFNRYRIDHVDIATDEDYVKGLMGFFKNR